MSAAAALLVAVAEHTEDVEPLSGKSLLITLAIIVAICAAILLAGFGYFTSEDSDKH
jgi:O-antigen/teichoic acid export membrane protein